MNICKKTKVNQSALCLSLETAVPQKRAQVNNISKPQNIIENFPLLCSSFDRTSLTRLPDADDDDRFRGMGNEKDEGSLGFSSAAYATRA